MLRGMPVAVYARISSDPLAMREGVERQLKDCRAIAGIRWPDETIVEHVDNDVSAWSGVKRPEYTRMIYALKRGEYTAVVAWNLDRLLRQPRELEALIDLGVPIVTATGDLDLTTHDGQLQARILVAVARKSSDDASRRVKRAQQDRRERGQWHGGPVPFGYKRAGYGVIEPDPVAAAIVRRAAVSIERGGTLRSLVELGGPTTQTGWKLLLNSPVIAGLNIDMSQASWQGIIPVAQWVNVRAINDARSVGRRPRKFWAHGIVQCAQCGKAMVSHINHKEAVYACRWHATISKRLLELHIEGALFASTKAIQQAPEPSACQGSGDGTSPLVEAAKLYARGVISLDEWLAVRQAVPVEQLPEPVPVVPRELEALWPSLSIPERRELASRLLVRVTVGPGRGLERVSFVWH